MCLELAYINSRVRLNETIESSLEDFAGRSGLEDVNNFYQVFAFAKRGGGNFVRIIETCAKQIGDKREIMRLIGDGVKTLRAKTYEYNSDFAACLCGNFVSGFYGTVILESVWRVRDEHMSFGLRGRIFHFGKNNRD